MVCSYHKASWRVNIVNIITMYGGLFFPVQDLARGLVKVRSFKVSLADGRPLAQ